MAEEDDTSDRRPRRGARPAGGQERRDPKAEANRKKPPPGDVADFHANSDVDAHAQALHHTLGFGGSQAAPGDHSHSANSPDSLPLWTNVTLTDPSTTASAAELSAAIAALNALIRQKATGA